MLDESLCIYNLSIMAGLKILNVCVPIYAKKYYQFMHFKYIINLFFKNL